MLSFRSIVGSTFGELKDALFEGDEEEDPDEEQDHNAHQTSLGNKAGFQDIAPPAWQSETKPAWTEPGSAVAGPGPALLPYPSEWGVGGATGSSSSVRDVSSRPLDWPPAVPATPPRPAQPPLPPGPPPAAASWSPGSAATQPGDGRSPPSEAAPTPPPMRPPPQDPAPIPTPTAAEAGAPSIGLGPGNAPESDAGGGLAAVLQGEVVQLPAQLAAEASAARGRFAALIGTPGLLELLRECGADPDGDGAWGSVSGPSVPRIACLCAEALRLVLPRALAADVGGDRHRLLASFSERYDALAAQHEQLQRRCREMAERLAYAEHLAQQSEAWQSAHRASTSRVEELALENADLKERFRGLEQRGVDPEERRALLQLVAQREAELRAAGEALRQLQEVLEDGAGASDARVGRLEAELRQARREAEESQHLRRSLENAESEARRAAAALGSRDQELEGRLRALERELRDTSGALEGLLQEKAKHLEEREHLVDRRLVTSMLALFSDHLASGQRALADQVLSQTLAVLGGESAVEDRQRLRAEAAAAEARAAEPLGDAFLDFLAREVEDDDLSATGNAAPAPARTDR